MVEGSGLENRRCASIRGFESHSLRHITKTARLGGFCYIDMDICRVGFERRQLKRCHPNEAEGSQSEPAVRIPRPPFAAPGTTEGAAFGAADIFFTQGPRIIGKIQRKIPYRFDPKRVEPSIKKRRLGGSRPELPSKRGYRIPGSAFCGCSNGRSGPD